MIIKNKILVKKSEGVLSTRVVRGIYKFCDLQVDASADLTSLSDTSVYNNSIAGLPLPGNHTLFAKLYTTGHFKQTVDVVIT